MTFSLTAPLFVEVSVPLPIDHPFTYRVPEGEEHRAQVGVRVLVPFGGRKMTGLVTAITDASALDGRAAKDLLAILDETPYVSERHLAFLTATARGCLAPLGETLRAALPRGLPRKEAPAAPRMESFYRPSPFPPRGAMTPKQRQAYEAVRESGGISSTDLSTRVPGGADAAKRLAAKGFLLVESRPRPVGLHAASLPDLVGDLAPTPGQEAALSRIGVAVASGRHAAFVLHGVTGSGKTEVYLRAVEQVRATRPQAIFLLPPIPLPPPPGGGAHGGGGGARRGVQAGGRRPVPGTGPRPAAGPHGGRRGPAGLGNPFRGVVPQGTDRSGDAAFPSGTDRGGRDAGG